MKINWKDFNDSDADDNEIEVSVAFLKNNKWHIYSSSTYDIKTKQDAEELIQEAMSEENVKRSNIKLVIPNYIMFEAVSSKECERRAKEREKQAKLKQIKRVEWRLKEQQKRLTKLKKAAKK